jgi:pilus assembly protein CpaB
MAYRLKIALVAAVIFGFIAAAGSYSYLRQQNAAAEAMKKALQQVVVAAKDVPAGTMIDEKALADGLLKQVAWPKDSIPTGSFSSTDKLLGKAVNIKLVAGEPILASRVGDAAGLPGRLTPGYRALAIKTDEVSGVSGFISPDDRVDVIATVNAPGGSNEKISKIVLQDKRVLSVASNAEQKGSTGQTARSITLEVTPEEAERLSVAQFEGQMSLALRSARDEKKVTTAGSSAREIFGAPSQPKAAVKAAAPHKQEVEVYLGNKKSVAEF